MNDIDMMKDHWYELLETRSNFYLRECNSAHASRFESKEEARAAGEKLSNDSRRYMPVLILVRTPDKPKRYLPLSLFVLDRLKVASQIPVSPMVQPGGWRYEAIEFYMCLVKDQDFVAKWATFEREKNIIDQAERLVDDGIKALMDDTSGNGVVVQVEPAFRCDLLQALASLGFDRHHIGQDWSSVLDFVHLTSK